jgi:dihydrofolate reductase
MSADIALVVGVAENGVIGAEGGLPWRVKADLKRFRTDTMGKPMVMGRKTFQSIGRILDGRDNIVVTRQPGYARPGAIVAKSLDDALSVAETCAEARGTKEICVIGGGEIFRETFPLATRLYVTHVSGTPEGDTFFPAIVGAEWEERSRERLPSSEGDTATAEHVVYERRK